MKIIFSRKGFDNSYGGKPSPIFTVGAGPEQMCSIPIPEMLPCKRTYSEIRFPHPDYPDIGIVVEQLTRGNYSGRFCAHLDPDLRPDAVPDRSSSWRPLFGQDGGSQTHLENQGVIVGDLFFFYGLFQGVVPDKHLRLRYIKDSPKHVIFGWLCIGAIKDKPSELEQWMSYHSHAYGEPWRRKNAIYVAAEKFGDLPGAGYFSQYQDELRLTMEEATASVWALPKWFDPRRCPAPLSYNCNVPKKWAQLSDGRWKLQTTSPGQEFVLSSDNYPEAVAWASDLIRRFGTASDGSST
jgi:hypothetical protein